METFPCSFVRFIICMPMLSQLHPSAISIKACGFLLLLLLNVIVSISKHFHLNVYCSQRLRPPHWREVGETGHQSYQPGLQLHCLIWFYEKKAHGGGREKLLGGKCVLWNATPGFLTKWKGEAYVDLLKDGDGKEARADFWQGAEFSFLT